MSPSATGIADDIGVEDLFLLHLFLLDLLCGYFWLALRTVALVEQILVLVGALLQILEGHFNLAQVTLILCLFKIFLESRDQQPQVLKGILVELQLVRLHLDVLLNQLQSLPDVA